jgi:hypothetical protein
MKISQIRKYGGQREYVRKQYGRSSLNFCLIQMSKYMRSSEINEI